MTTPWITKHRPTSLDDVQIDETIRSTLRDKIQNGKLDNMIFSGPCGTGKTTCARCIGHEVLGRRFHKWFLELNASNDRGITTVRDYIHHFASVRTKAPFKIVFLDEADSMTSQAQEALCQIIENHADTTRFILSCNDYQRMIELLRTRCSFIEFQKLNNADIVEKINDIFEKENVSCDENAKQSIAYYSDGDARRALTIIQTLAITTNHITEEQVQTLCDESEYRCVIKLIESCQQSNFSEIREYLYTLLQKGTTLFDIVELILKISETYDTQIAYKIFIHRFEITSVLQLEGLLADLC